MTRMPETSGNVPIPASGSNSASEGEVLRWPSTDNRMSSPLLLSRQHGLKRRVAAKACFLQGWKASRSSGHSRPECRCGKSTVLLSASSCRVQRESISGSRPWARGDEGLVVSLDLPATGRIVEAREDEPYIGITIELDVAMMREIVREMQAPPPAAGPGPVLLSLRSKSHLPTVCAASSASPTRLMPSRYSIPP
jgi:hypothetical protein